MTEREALQQEYYKARRERMAAKEYYDATVCEEQRLAQRIWKLLRPADDA
jgi:hypothetical protein